MPDGGCAADANRLQPRATVDSELVTADRTGIDLFSHLVSHRDTEAGSFDQPARDRDTGRRERRTHQDADKARDGNPRNEEVDGLLVFVLDVRADVDLPVAQPS